MILIKLGGSIITNKERPQSARRKTIDNILKQIKRIDEPKILVHGGGSYGHYWSVKYGMHTKPARYSLKGLSIVKNSMIELDKIILDGATKNRLNTYSLPPTDFMKGNKPIRNKIQKIGEIAKSGLVPVTYGDALWYGQKKSYILSGDVIMTMIGKVLKPRLSVFVLNVDGVYSNIKSKKLNGGKIFADGLLYIFLISLMKDVSRLFQYHGAEHRVVYNFESGEKLKVKNAQNFPTQHPRCGTSFMFIVLLSAIIVFSLIDTFLIYIIGDISLPIRLMVHLPMIPFVAGISYEVIKITARKENNFLFRLLRTPGLWLQNITTKKPDDDMVEVAIIALKEAFGENYDEMAGKEYIAEAIG